MDVWWNNHFLCNDLESSNWNNHKKTGCLEFQDDLTGLQPSIYIFANPARWHRSPESLAAALDAGRVVVPTNHLTRRQTSTPWGDQKASSKFCWRSCFLFSKLFVLPPKKKNMLWFLSKGGNKSSLCKYFHVFRCFDSLQKVCLKMEVPHFFELKPN